MRSIRRPRPLAELEKRAIRDAIAYCKGNIVQAAGVLGMGKTSIYRKLIQYKKESKRLARKRKRGSRR